MIPGREFGRYAMVKGGERPSMLSKFRSIGAHHDKNYRPHARGHACTAHFAHRTTYLELNISAVKKYSGRAESRIAAGSLPDFWVDRRTRCSGGIQLLRNSPTSRPQIVAQPACSGQIRFERSPLFLNHLPASSGI